MEKVSDSVASHHLKGLLEGIKAKYQTYHMLDRDRFPEIEFNTNRANYEPLRASFEEELFVTRGLDRTAGTIHIPSTNTLALMFSNDSYVPGKKILNTCRSYAESRPKTEVRPIAPPEVPPIPIRTENRNRTGLWIGLSIAVVGLIGYGLLNQLVWKSRARDLVIDGPKNGQVVVRMPFVEGKVTNADRVWIFVRPVREAAMCYAQPSIKVKKDGTWRGQIYIGGIGTQDVGKAFQIRAFVNSDGIDEAVEREGKELFAKWPEDAELATEAVIVIRGPESSPNQP